MIKLPIAFIDSFTSVPFKGNPTAVCISSHGLEPQLMLSIAAELNCPVTAFLSRTGVNDAYDIRYFTTTTEIPACGHATLAAARMILDQNPQIPAVNFLTIDKIRIEAIADGSNIMMTYPAYSMTAYTVSEKLLSSLQLPAFNTAGYCLELETLFIEVDDPQILRTVAPDYESLIRSDHTIKEVVITSASDVQEFDYLLRSFCPWIGINEDPVTGSVHSVLGNFWKRRLKKNVLKAYQASSRGGELLINVFDDHTQIGGKSVIIFLGEFML